VFVIIELSDNFYSAFKEVYFMGMSDKQYDKALALAQKKRAKNQNKLESPNGNN